MSCREEGSSRKLGRIGSARFRPVAPCRWSTGRKEWGMFARGMHQLRWLRWLRGLFLTLLAAMLVSSCGGGSGSQEQDSTEDTTTTTEDTEQAINITIGDSGQAPEDALDAALEQSFSESGTPGVVAAVQTPQYTWVRALGVADRTSEEPMTP